LLAAARTELGDQNPRQEKKALQFQPQTRIPASVWVWRMVKAFGSFVTVVAGVALLSVDINLPFGNDTLRILVGAILLSLSLIYVFSEFKEWTKDRQLFKESRE
jgi:hypothetical protein